MSEAILWCKIIIQFINFNVFTEQILVPHGTCMATKFSRNCFTFLVDIFWGGRGALMKLLQQSSKGWDGGVKIKKQRK